MATTLRAVLRDIVRRSKGDCLLHSLPSRPIAKLHFQERAVATILDAQKHVSPFLTTAAPETAPCFHDDAERTFTVAHMSIDPVVNPRTHQTSIVVKMELRNDAGKTASMWFTVEDEPAPFYRDGKIFGGVSIADDVLVV